MTIEHSNLSSEIEDMYVSVNGNFYFFKNFIVTEIHDGVNFTWENGQNVLAAAKKHYGPTINVTIISNRINEYSINPQDWIKFFKADFKIKSYLVVANNKRHWLNALLEKTFLNNNIVKRFTNLHDAIDWAKANNIDNQVFKKAE